MTKSHLNFISMSLICLAALLLQPELENRLYGKAVEIPKRIEGTVVQTAEKEEKNNPVTPSAEGGGVKGSQSSVTIKGELSLKRINEMDAKGLEQINGIGPVLAERIVAYRKSHGPFKRIKELGNVKGIGEKKLKAIEAQLTKEE